MNNWRIPDWARKRISKREPAGASSETNGATGLKALTPARWLAGTALVVSCLTLASCATPRSARSQDDPELVRLIEFWRTYQLYLQASTHPRLYVELDAVAGYVPSEVALGKLRAFLTAYCDKPGGIELVRSDVIPAATARGVPPRALARKFINGPPETPATTPPAFLYVLFYDGVLSRQPAVAETGQPVAKTAPRPRARGENPRTDLLPYPAIFMNANWGPKAARDGELVHEAGHALGLAFRPTHAFDGHCLDHECLMTASVHIGRLLFGRDAMTRGRLCEHCAAQLRDTSRTPPPSNLRFVGPVLVRSEAGYHVLSLPNRLEVIFGALAGQDCRDFAAEVRDETLAPGCDDRWSAQGWIKDDAFAGAANLREVMDRAKADPHQTVRTIASRALAPACAGRYCASGEYTNAVEILRQAILFDPHDDLSYNNLAWIKATCADASVRNGQEAVAAATKACELTDWKAWSWIDTLAVACAEAGDFQRAIQLEEQALRTGNPTGPERRQMRDHIALYRESRPIRENAEP